MRASLIPSIIDFKKPESFRASVIKTHHKQDSFAVARRPSDDPLSRNVAGSSEPRVTPPSHASRRGSTGSREATVGEMIP